MNLFKQFYKMILLSSIIMKSQQMSINADDGITNNSDKAKSKNVAVTMGTMEARTFGLLRPLVDFGLAQAIKSNLYIGNYYYPGLLPVAPSILPSYPFRYGVQNPYTTYGYSGYTTIGSYPPLIGVSAFQYNRRPAYGFGPYDTSYGSSTNTPFINRPIITSTNQNHGSSTKVNPTNSNYGSNNNSLHNNNNNNINNNNNNAQLLQLANLLGQILGKQLRPHINGGNLTGSPVTYARIN